MLKKHKCVIIGEIFLHYGIPPKISFNFNFMKIYLHDFVEPTLEYKILIFILNLLI
jgi:hypothetical protein